MTEAIYTHAKTVKNAQRMCMRMIFLGLVGLITQFAAADNAPNNWVEVDTQALTMTVRNALGNAVATYDSISIGRGGSAFVHYGKDGTTPLGQYRIVAIIHPHVFDTFYQFDYPTPQHAELAVTGGKLNHRAYQRIIAAAKTHHMPPQHTVLGGGIGIHGTGRGDPAIHAAFNWTRGCVALSNEQLHDFAHWARVGMRVDVH